MGARGLWVCMGGGGLTCCFWAVFGGGWGSLFLSGRRAGFGELEMGGSGRARSRAMPTHDDEAVMNGAPDFEEGLRCGPPAGEAYPQGRKPVPMLSYETQA